MPDAASLYERINPIIPYFRSQAHWLILWHEKTRRKRNENVLPGMDRIGKEQG
jgi:hypothetical protein